MPYFLKTSFLKTLSILVLFVCSNAFAQSNESALKSNKSQNEMVPEALIQLTDSPHFSNTVFVVDKAARLLTIWEYSGEGAKKVAEYPTDIGKKEGAKLKLNDHRTPEGVYFLLERKSGKELAFDLYGSLAFTTDYPNHFDKIDGKTGYGIWLHGIPDTVPLTRGSRGCVVVRNAVIQEIEKQIKVGQTPMLIFNQVKYVSPKEQQSNRKELQTFIENWRAAWQSQDIDKYMGFYGNNFISMGMNQKAWKKYKESLKSKYAFIKVQLSPAAILNHSNQYVVRTLQTYSSDQFSDFGEKTLYIQKTSDGLRIVGEEWRPVKDQLAAQQDTSKGPPL